jgi:hypothetical protein
MSSSSSGLGFLTFNQADTSSNLVDGTKLECAGVVPSMRLVTVVEFVRLLSSRLTTGKETLPVPTGSALTRS